MDQSLTVKKDSQILCYIDTWDRYRFFLRFSDHFPTAIYLTEKLSIYLKGRRQGLDMRLAVKSNSMNGAFNVLDLRYADKELRNAGINNAGYVLLFNGHQNDIARMIGSISARNNIPTLFFEIGNLPGKLFVDRVGVNAKASVANGVPDTEDPQTVNVANEIFLNKKRIAIPQQVNFYKRLNAWAILDRIGFVFSRVSDSEQRKFTKIFEKMIPLNWVVQETYDPKEQYDAIIVLQLDNDTNIRLHVTPKNYIYEMMNCVGDNRKRVLVSLHPATTNIAFARTISAECRMRDWDIIIGKSSQFLDSAKEIYTFNSSFSLESSFFGKNTRIIGPCFFKHWTKGQISNFVTQKLVDFDYFGETKVSKAVWHEILRKSKWPND